MGLERDTMPSDTLFQEHKGAIVEHGRIQGHHEIWNGQPVLECPKWLSGPIFLLINKGSPEKCEN